MHTLLLMLLTAAPQFEVKGPTPEERARRAQIHCGGAADVSELDGGVATFICHDSLGVDLTDELRRADLVVRGKVIAIETPSAKLFADPSPGWRRATVKVLRTLKGASVREVKFLFISSTKDGNESYPKVKVGQEGVWLLMGDEGAVRELMLYSSVDSQPPSAEDYLRELIAGVRCPEQLAGTCATAGAKCPGKGVTCTCEPPCGGGAHPPPDYVAQLSWVCRPTACATAKEGGTCAPNGMGCEGCWGTHPWTCEKGRWKYHRIPPPP